MRTIVIPEWIVYDNNISTKEEILLCSMIYNFTKTSGMCYCNGGFRYLAESINRSEDDTFNVLGGLSKKGYIKDVWFTREDGEERLIGLKFVKEGVENG